MRTPTSFLALLVLASATTLTLYAAPPTGEITVRYLANEGFWIAAGETEILIDALFGDGLEGYAAVPPGPRQELEMARGTYAGVDLVLATHHHGDHFDPEAVARHLRNNPEASFFSTRQAVAKLKRLSGFAEIEDRVRGFWPAEGERVVLEHAGVRLTVLRLHHGRNRQPPVENLGFLIELQGLRLLHVGDTEVTVADVRPYNLGEAKIDVFFAPAWYWSYPKWRPVLAEVNARARVVMHLAEPDAPPRWFGSDRSRAQRLRRILEEDPEAIVLRPMESRRFAAVPPGRPPSEASAEGAE